MSGFKRKLLCGVYGIKGFSTIVLKHHYI